MEIKPSSSCIRNLFTVCTQRNIRRCLQCCCRRIPDLIWFHLRIGQRIHRPLAYSRFCKRTFSQWDRFKSAPEDCRTGRPIDHELIRLVSTRGQMSRFLPRASFYSGTSHSYSAQSADLFVSILYSKYNSCKFCSQACMKSIFGPQ